MIFRLAAAAAIAAALALAATVRPPRALPAFSPLTTSAAPSPAHSARFRSRRWGKAPHRTHAHGKGRAQHRRAIRVVDVNRAGVDALAAIPGVGEELARRIVTYRALVGRFDSLDDLSDLDGLSESKLISLGRYLVVR